MKYVAVLLLTLFVPISVYAEVQITEVAWMGTVSSQYSEWIELYNDGSSSVDLAGWKLYEGDGGALVFTFTKSIPAQGYLLLERTTPSAPDAVPGINDEAGPFGGSGLANTGEDLVLKDAGGALVEELNYLSGWPAGDATTKKTMQWDGSSWITAIATPKASAEGDIIDEEEEEQVDSEEHGATEVESIPKISPNKPHVKFQIPPTVYKGISYQYNAQPILEYNYQITNGSMYWNFGDGTTVLQDTLAPVSHVYEYPGSYTLSFLYTDPTNTNPPLKATKKVLVTSPGVSMKVVDGKAFEIKNTSSSEIDLSGWKISTPGRAVTIPDLTVISEKATAIIPFAALGVNTGITHAVLLDPSGSVVTTSAPAQQRVSSLGSTVIAADQPMIEPDTLVASAIERDDHSPIRNRTKTIIFGAVALFVIGLSILLERVMARREYQEE